MANITYYSKPKLKAGSFINPWDLIILVLFFGVLAALVWGAQQMTAPYELGKTLPISLDLKMLPRYALSTIIRMGIALFFSLLFTFTVATLAAKNARAEKFILPLIDIMQSVPVLGFLSISIIAFISLFPGTQLGPECAAIFAIFTSQVWNMALSFYQSLRTVPKDLKEAAVMFHLSPWQTFWRLEVPFATPSLIWNTMMSLSAGWFFVVAAEAISVNNQQIYLPGIGSYIMLATQQANYHAIAYVIITMLIVILLYDQLIFRPLIAWSEKFKLEADSEHPTQAWFLDILQRSQLVRTLVTFWRRLRDLVTAPKFLKPSRILWHSGEKKNTVTKFLWFGVLFIGIASSCILFIRFIYLSLTLHEIGVVFGLGLITAAKIMVLIILCSIIWIPIGVWIGLRPQWVNRVAPFAQFLAAFPANLVYPVIFMLILSKNLSVNLWSAPLMILGTQWYILFNVIAGASSLPQELHLVAKNYGVKNWLWWKKFILPAIFPYYVTGAMTAVGGSWNASIVAEVVTWGNQTYHAVGLGSYIAQYTEVGHFPRIALGIAVMSLYVIVINRLVWQKLYDFAENRFHLG